MKFIAFGLNHETSSLELSEGFSLGESVCCELVEEFGSAIDSELVLLSTCNRTEVYLYGREADAAFVREKIARTVGKPWPHDEAFEFFDEAAVRHVMQVCVGARSLVPGDSQILAQMKEAYERAVDADAVDMVMHRLMHTAFRAAKRVARETDLSSGAASVSSAAVAMATSYYDEHTSAGFAGRQVLLLGAGQMGQLALKAVQRYEPASLLISNRSPERAKRVAAQYDGTVIPWQKRHQSVAEADLVLVATGAPEPVVRADDLPARVDASGVPVLVVDIARPRNVAPAVEELAGYVVRDLDDLQGWVGQVQQARREELPSAAEICEEMLSEFVSWVFHQEALQPAINAIRSTFENIRQQEIERHEHRFSDADRKELNQITQSILQKLLAVPIVRLKSVDPDSMDFVRGIKLLSTLFSRPSGDDSSDGEGSAANSSARCPFETHDEEQAGDDESLDIEQLRRILDTLENTSVSSLDK